MRAYLVPLILAIPRLSAVDTTPPTITGFALAPVDGAVVSVAPTSATTSATVVFSEAIDPASVSATTVQLIASGGDGTFADGNETTITPSGLTLVTSTQLRLDLSGITLADDVYRVQLVQPTGGSLHFDGGGQLATMANNPSLNPTAAITLECWFNFEVGGNWNPRMIERDWYNIGTTTTNASRVVGVGYGLEGTTLFPAGTWHHAAMSATDGGQWFLYVDGQLENSIASHAISSSSIPLRLGRSRNVGFDQYQGLIDEVRVWSIARSQAEIQGRCRCRCAGTSPGWSAIGAATRAPGRPLPMPRGMATTAGSATPWPSRPMMRPGRRRMRRCPESGISRATRSMARSPGRARRICRRGTDRPEVMR